MAEKANSSNEDALLNASAILGFAAIVGGVLGMTFAKTCDGQAPVCGPVWGALDGIAVAEGLAALGGGALATLRPKDKTGIYVASVAGLITGGIAVANAIRAKQPAPPPAASVNAALPAATNSATTSV